MNVLVFNELSVQKQDSVIAAKAMMETFVLSAAKARENGFSEIRLPAEFGSNLYHLEIADEYPVARWKDDPEVDRILIRRFLGLAQKSPLIHLDRDTLRDDPEWTEVIFEIEGEKKQGRGLSAAWLLEVPALSFHSSPTWEAPVLSATHCYLSEKATIVEKDVEVLNIARPEHYDYHSEQIELARANSIQSGLDLWNQRESFFPNLVFCGDTENQIKGMGSSKQMIQVRDRLSILNDAVVNWKQGPFTYGIINHDYGLNISPESEQTMARYRSTRSFRLPEGGTEIFELHLKFGSGLRIHILPLEVERKVLIGYIGPHLPIISGL